ncbi:MAG: SUMF1/EgtB/PvdO family nonheme iron enzyme [Chloroflexota bacterium]
MLRGGSWNNNRNNCRCSVRNRNNPDNFNNNVGFRVVLSHNIFPARSAAPSTDGGRGKTSAGLLPAQNLFRANTKPARFLGSSLKRATLFLTFVKSPRIIPSTSRSSKWTGTLIEKETVVEYRDHNAGSLRSTKPPKSPGAIDEESYGK